MPTGTRKSDKKNCNAWLGKEDREILETLALLLGSTKTDVIRTSIHQLYEKLTKEQKDTNANTDPQH